METLDDDVFLSLDDIRLCEPNGREEISEKIETGARVRVEGMTSLNPPPPLRAFSQVSGITADLQL